MFEKDYVEESTFNILENQVGDIESRLSDNDANISEIVNALSIISRILSQKYDTSELDEYINSINY